MGLPGATVLRGITGFGSSKRVPRPQFRGFLPDAPIVVELVAPERQILSFLTEAQDVLKDRLVILWPAEVLPASRRGAALSLFPSFAPLSPHAIAAALASEPGKQSDLARAALLANSAQRQPGVSLGGRLDGPERS